MKINSGYIAEIFPSIQGEGLCFGEHQLFIRLAGCSFACDYCDTTWAQKPEPEKMIVKFMPFGKKNIKIANPLSADGLINLIEKLINKCGPVSTLAITGGEPLEQVDFLEELVKKIKKSNIESNVLLETNGLEVDSYIKVRKYIDILSMDIKIKSTTGKPLAIKKVKAFLDASKNNYGWIKVVINHNTTVREIVNVAKMIQQSTPEKELILQPAMKGKKEFDVRMSFCYILMKTALNYHHKVRIIPQLHKLTGIA